MKYLCFAATYYGCVILVGINTICILQLRIFGYLRKCVSSRTHFLVASFNCSPHITYTYTRTYTYRVLHIYAVLNKQICWHILVYWPNNDLRGYIFVSHFQLGKHLSFTHVCSNFSPISTNRFNSLENLGFDVGIEIFSFNYDILESFILNYVFKYETFRYMYLQLRNILCTNKKYMLFILIFFVINIHYPMCTTLVILSIRLIPKLLPNLGCIVSPRSDKQQIYIQGNKMLFN